MLKANEIHPNRLAALLLMIVLLALAGCNQGAGQPAQKSKPVATEQANDHGGEAKENAGHSGNHDEGGEQDHGEHADKGHGEDKRAIHLSDAQRQRLDLKIGKAGSGSATAMIQAPATVAFDADRVARVGPRLEAKVLEVTKDLGDTVKKGETVAILDSVELGRAKARFMTTAASLESARAEYYRDRKLAKQKITSESEVMRSKAAYLQARAERQAARAELRLYGMDGSDIDSISMGGKQPLSRYVLAAPIAGTIQQRDLVQGQTVSAQQTPIHIVNSEQMWVMIEAYERDSSRLATGQAITLKIRALPEQTFNGKTDWVSSELDEENRTLRVRAVVPNDKGLLRAGMFGTASIDTGSTQRFALVPVDAVQNVDKDDVVFVPGDEAGAFRAVTVRTGAENGGRMEIKSGLQPGDRLVTGGAFDLKSALTAGGRSAAHSH